jgi:hypothetical protein
MREQTAGTGLDDRQPAQPGKDLVRLRVIQQKGQQRFGRCHHLRARVQRPPVADGGNGVDQGSQEGAHHAGQLPCHLGVAALGYDVGDQGQRQRVPASERKRVGDLIAWDPAPFEQGRTISGAEVLQCDRMHQAVPAGIGAPRGRR